jgi:hypothetical protein
MRKFFYLSIVCSVLLFGCTDNFTQGEDPINSTESVEKDPTTRIVSAQQAQVFAEKAVGAIQEKGDTVVVKNSVSRTVKEVTPLKSSGGETVLYLINFNDERGHMLLSADKEAANSMLSFDTKGNFDLATVEEGSTVWAWLETEKAKISENFKSGMNKDHQGYQLWEYIIGDEDGEVTLEIANIDEMNNGDKPLTRGRHTGSYNLSNISPWYSITSNLWGVGTGYNANAPISGVPIGGPAVAIGLLCKTHSYPAKYNYSAMPTKLNTSSPNAISQMLRDIANNIPGYTWSYSGSGATPSCILVGLKNIGYTSAKIKTYDFSTAYANIHFRYPVLLGAYQGYWGGGHIWIADGYYEQVWKITQTKKFLGITTSTKTWYEYVDMFYMNWGWNGSGNGWVDQADWNSSVNGSFNYDRKLFYDLKKP